MEKKMKHLELIQGVIQRMGNNSFLVKGWCITLVSVIMALGANSKVSNMVLLSLFPIIMFWILDAFYLWNERLYRRLYNQVRKADDDAIDFSMNIYQFSGNQRGWIDAIFSISILIFYGTLIFLDIIMLIIYI